MTKELKKLYNYGYEVFGDKQKFHKWLERDCMALGGKAPASFLVSEDGIEKVYQILGRIDYGVYS